MTTGAEGFGGFIRPTEIERLHGRLMRAPDHDAGAPPSDPPAPSGDAAPAGDGADGAPPPAADPPAADAPAAGSGDADPAPSAGTDDAGSLIGNAGTDKQDDAGDEPKKDDEPPAPAVPEAYELEPLKVGEGDSAVELQVDKEFLTELTPDLKEAGVTSEQLTKLAPLALKIEERVRATLNDQFRATTSDWAKEAKADPEIGGSKWKDSINSVGKALDWAGHASQIKEVDGKQVETEPLRAFLNQTGFGNHPALIRLLAKVGGAVSEDGALPRGDKGASTPVPAAHRLFPNDVPKQEGN